MRKVLLVFSLILAGCNTLHRALGDRDSNDRLSGAISYRKNIKVVIAGQSNANNPMPWNDLKDLFATQRIDFEWTQRAESGTSAWQWELDMSGMTTRLINACKEQPDYVLIVQGEADPETTAEDYANFWEAVIKRINEVSHPKIYFALCSYNVHGHGDPRGGQKLLVERGLAFQGPDVDKYRANPMYARDGGLHFTEEGHMLIAVDWFRIILGKTGGK